MQNQADGLGVKPQKFDVKLFGENVWMLKASSTFLETNTGKTWTSIFAVDASFTLMHPLRVQGSEFQPVMPQGYRSLLSQEALYYPVDQMVYIGVGKVKVDHEGAIQSNSFSLFLPLQSDGKKVLASDVTMSIPLTVKQSLAEMSLNYI